MPRGATLSVVLTNGRCVILGVLIKCSACSDVVFANIGCGQVMLPNTSVITQAKIAPITQGHFVQ